MTFYDWWKKKKQSDKPDIELTEEIRKLCKEAWFEGQRQQALRYIENQEYSEENHS